MHKEFTYKSDFSYDSKENDIVFIVNKVQNRDGEYSYHTGDDFTNREMLFYRKYKDVLDRLAILENKKEQMYEDNKHLINRKFVDFQKAKESLKSVQDYNYTFTRGYLQTIAEDLVKEYGIKSIKDLIFLLNKIDLVSDPESIYKTIVMNGKSKNYKQDLFSWISTYSNPGYNFSEKYYEELFPIHYHKRPDYEQIKLDNMLKLHM